MSPSDTTKANQRQGFSAMQYTRLGTIFCSFPRALEEGGQQESNCDDHQDFHFSCFQRHFQVKLMSWGCHCNSNCSISSVMLAYFTTNDLPCTFFYLFPPLKIQMCSRACKHQVGHVKALLLPGTWVNDVEDLCRQVPDLLSNSPKGVGKSRDIRPYNACTHSRQKVPYAVVLKKHTAQCNTIKTSSERQAKCTGPSVQMDAAPRTVVQGWPHSFETQFVYSNICRTEDRTEQVAHESARYEVNKSSTSTLLSDDAAKHFSVAKVTKLSSVRMFSLKQ